ncbi:biotin/lipoyl-binding protein [Tropicimonas sp. TH_r6]|uniref:efflux RND transporter periplasmic adaptor subunit n=1 Tax=Tropicimonas sp. TH_r6 TaxID=3082085 RepID=UPI002953E7AC|nr:biotin/lipoyl-binding protein [Tropicimonas sp. TH_r6]MDV7142716.1 biotin/lipoyl-binding protein [Tropicimonas sp. TH_r6]
MTRLARPLLLAAALLAAGGFATWQGSRLDAAISGEDRRPPRPRKEASARTEVSVVTPAPSAITPVSTVYGQISAPNRVTLIPSASGRIVEVLDGLRDGARVTTGDLLLRLDDTEAALSLREAEAALASAETTRKERRRNITEAQETLALLGELLALKEAELDRTNALIEKGTYSPNLLETSRAALLAARQSVSQGEAALAASRDLARQAEIAVDQATLAVESAETTLADHALIAPISGIFSGERPIAGQHLSDSSIGTLVDMDSLEIRLDLTQAVLSRITGPEGGLLALPITATRPGSEVSAPGRLDRLTIADASDDSDQSIAIARLTSTRTAGLRPGDFVEVQITEPTLDDLLSVPASSVLPDDSVLAVTEGVLERLPALVLRRQGERVILATQALAGREILLLPGGELQAGMRVTTSPASPLALAESAE